MREAVGVFDVSHLGKARVRGPGRGGLRQRLPDQRPGPDRAGPGAVHAVLRRRDRRRGRRPHRLPVRRRPRLPDPERGEHRRGGAPAARRPRRPASTVTDEHEEYAVLAVQGPRSAELLAALGPADRARLHELRDGRPGRGRADRVPHRLHRRARLRAGRAVRATPSPSGTRCSTPARRTALRACGLGARDTLRTEMGYPLHGQDLSLEITPVQARLGLGGRLEQAGVLGPRRAARREGGRARAARCGAWRRSTAASRAPHMTVLAGDDRGRRGHQRHVLADPQGRHRAGPARHRGRARRGRRGRGRRPRPARVDARRQAAVRHALGRSDAHGGQRTSRCATGCWRCPAARRSWSSEWGHPTLRVNGKMFASGMPGSPTITVKATKEEQAALLAAAPKVYSLGALRRALRLGAGGAVQSWTRTSCASWSSRHGGAPRRRSW